MGYETVIGLEIHAELKTRTKIFCGCENKFGGEPNTRCCPVCLGMPGTLPVLNRTAVEYAVKAGLAMNCRISRLSKMDRKNYFYPDLPKAYQISQYNIPICQNGFVDIQIGNETKRIGIERIHLEEDAGKLMHDPDGCGSLIDFNRCGVPLIEIVTCPDLRSPEEAKILLETIKSILKYIEVSDCKMEEGSLRADVNLSLRPQGQEAFGVRTEMKNINTLRAVKRAAEFEAARQADVLKNGGEIFQETRRWDDAKGESFVMRTKEETMDYRFFPEPDLVPMEIDDEWLESIRKSLPELPQSRRDRYVKQFGIPQYDAALITLNRHLSDIFDRASSVCGNPKLASNWIMTDIMRRMNEKGDSILDSLSGDDFGTVLALLDKGEITHAAAKTVLDLLLETGEDPRKIIERLGLTVQRDEALVANTVKSVLQQNPKAVSDYLSGKDKAFTFLMGKAMASLKGRGDPSQVGDALKKELMEYGHRQ